jgi:hypothetical protein
MPRGKKKASEAGAEQKPAYKLVRKNKESGAIEPRKVGRRAPGFEYGYTGADGEFKAGDPPGTKAKAARVGRRRNRPAAMKGNAPSGGIRKIADKIAFHESALAEARKAMAEALGL